MPKKNPFKLQRGCYMQGTWSATLRKVEGRSTFLATRNATIAVANMNFFSCKLQRNVSVLRCKLQEKLLLVTWP